MQILLLQLFPPISHWIRRRCSAVYVSLLTPSILSQSDFVKSLSTARKSWRGFRKLFRRFTMTRLWREWRYKRLSKDKVKERAAADQRKLTARALIADIAAEVENDRRESVRKLTQAHDVSAITVYAALMRTAKLLKKSGICVKKWFSLEMKKGDSVRIRRPKRWQPRFFDSLKQRSHCLRGGRGQRESWPPSFSLRRPPRRAERRVRKIAWRRTSPRRYGGNKSAAWKREGRRRPY